MRFRMFTCPSKSRLRSVIRLFFCAAAISSGIVCAEDDAQALARLRSEMERMAGTPTCANVVHCRVVTMGYDACGNPTAMLTYNHVRGIDNELQVKAAEYTFIEEEQQRGKPKPANCAVARQPKLVCVNNRCIVGDTSY